MSTQPVSTPWQLPWPDGVIARYLTVGGATVDLAQEKPGAYVDSGHCTGCTFAIGWSNEKFARQDAQAHAAECRALPRPAVNG